MDAGCPDPTAIERFVDRRLSPQELAAVERHLAACDDCVDLVAAVAGNVGGSTGSGHGTRTTEPAFQRSVGTGEGPLQAGTMLGRYEVRRWLGRGGMGDVYEGFDRHLERRVALKVLRDAAGDADLARLRLAREARTLARLSHPNVVAVHDVALEGDRLFLVMELIEGLTLASWLKAEPRTWRQILDVFLDAGEGLAAAHAVGVIHRDFKPQNVLVGADGRVRVSDFGLARADRAEGSASSPANVPIPPTHPNGESLSATGGLVGTPRYMAPEQTLGHPIDARADQFSFAVALWEALYGMHPFSDHRAPGTASPQPVSPVIVDRPFDPPKRGGIPRACTAVLTRGLALTPALRYDSLAQLLSALRKIRHLRRQWLLGLVGAAALVFAAAGGWLAIRKPASEILSPIGQPADWSSTRVLFTVPDRIHCVDPLDDHTVRVVWGLPRQVEDVDLRTAVRRSTNLVPDAYRHGCPALSPDGRKLIFEGYDQAHRPHIFYADNPTGAGAKAIVASADPIFRSEPAWLRSSAEFIFDVDPRHSGIFSIRDERLSIVPDAVSRMTTVLGSSRAVSRTSDRFAIAELVGTSMGIYIFDWPSLRVEGTFLMPAGLGSSLSFDLDGHQLLGCRAAAPRDQFTKLDLNERKFSILGQIEGRDAFAIVPVTSGRTILVSRKETSQIAYRDHAEAVRTVPTHEYGWDKSPSVTRDGKILFVRATGLRQEGWLYDPATHQSEAVLREGDTLGVSALADGTFLAGRCAASAECGLFLCSMKDGLPACSIVASPIHGSVTASPDGKFAAYQVQQNFGMVARILSLESRSTVDLMARISGCQFVWSSASTVWVSELLDDTSRWTEFDVTTQMPTGKWKPGTTKCPYSAEDPAAPVAPRTWVTETTNYDLRVLDNDEGLHQTNLP